jgi:hypothetical protein
MSQVSGRKSQAKDKGAGFGFEQLEVYQLAVNVAVNQQPYHLPRYPDALT